MVNPGRSITVALDRLLSSHRALTWTAPIILVLYVVLVAYILQEVEESAPQAPGGLLLAVLAGLGAAVGWTVKKTIEDAHNARTIALALTSDVASIMKAIAKARIPQHFMLQYDKPDQQFPWADVARDENYFSAFDAHVGKLGALREPALAADVTTFYTFLKASRDATSSLLGANRPLPADPQKSKEKTAQTEEDKKKKQEDRRALVRSVSEGVCDILATTFVAGIRVIEDYKRFYDNEDISDRLRSRRAVARRWELIQNRQAECDEAATDRCRARAAQEDLLEILLEEADDLRDSQAWAERNVVELSRFRSICVRRRKGDSSAGAAFFDVMRQST